METQAQAPGQPQAPTPVNPVHQEQQDLEKFTKLVRDTPDNDPEHPTDTSAPQEVKEEVKAEEPKEEVQEVEFDEETPVFEIEYKTDSGKEQKKLSLKELREGYLAKQDYHRNIQKVKAQESQLAESLKQAEIKAQGEYLQKLELHKQAIQRFANVKTMEQIEQMAKEDPAGAQQEFLRYINVSQQWQALEAEQKQVMDKLQGERAAALEQQKLKTREILDSKIPGWGQELYGKILGTAVKEYGFKDEEVAPVVDARLLEVLHDAYQYRQLQKAKPEVSKRVVAIPKVIKPGSAEKPNPAKEDTERSYDRFKKTGKGEDFVNWYLNKNKKGK
jgi:hypothetical protein